MQRERESEIVALVCSFEMNWFCLHCKNDALDGHAK